MSTKTFNLHVPWMIELTMKDFALDLDSACAAWGNAGQESGGFENLQEGRPLSGRGGWGPFQWTGPRRVAFEAYCKRNGYKLDDPVAWYKWFFIESKGAERAWVEAVRAAPTLKEKVRVFRAKFERPKVGLEHDSVRLKWAEKAKAEYLAHPERRQPPPEVLESPMSTPTINPVPASRSKGVVGGIVAALMGVGVMFFPWMAKISPDTVTTIIMAVMGLITTLSGAVSAWGRIDARNPIAGSQAEADMRARMEAAINTPAPGQQLEAPSITQLPLEMLIQQLPALIGGLSRLNTAVRPLTTAPRVRTKKPTTAAKKGK